MHPQEKEIENEDQEVQEKEELEPLKDNSNSETQNSIIVHEQPSYEHVSIDSDNSNDDMPICDIVAPNNNFDNNEGCVLDMLYDNAFGALSVCHSE